MTKREKFGVVMQTLAETYRQQVTPLMLEGYWAGLNDLSEGEIGACAKLAIRTCKFMPTPADIRGLVRDVRAIGSAERTALMLEAQRNFTPLTDEQAAEVRASIRRLADAKS